MEEDRPQYLTVGIQLGERYEGSPIIWPDGTDDAPPPDTWDSYTPLDRPGARAPHFWLEPGRAAYDAFGKGFTLIDFGAPDGANAIERAAKARAVPLEDIAARAAGWACIATSSCSIRPDQHIAWHGDSVSDAMAVIDRVRGA